MTTPLLPARFWDKVVDPDDGSGCWLWIGARIPTGYGNFKWHGSFKKAHRLAFEEFKGEIPAGVELDHLCRNRSCVNPEHLDPVPHRINMLRSCVAPTGVNAAKTACVHGHALDVQNTYVTPAGERQCRRCHKDRNAKWRARRVA